MVLGTYLLTIPTFSLPFIDPRLWTARILRATWKIRTAYAVNPVGRSVSDPLRRVGLVFRVTEPLR